MAAATRKMINLKDEILADKMKNFNTLESNIISQLKNQLNKELTEAIKKGLKKRKLELAVFVFQHV